MRFQSWDWDSVGQNGSIYPRPKGKVVRQIKRAPTAADALQLLGSRSGRGGTKSLAALALRRSAPPARNPHRSPMREGPVDYPSMAQWGNAITGQFLVVRCQLKKEAPTVDARASPYSGLNRNVSQ